MDQEKFEALSGKVLNDIGGAIGVLMSYIGDQAGVYQTLEQIGPCSIETLAEASGIDQRYLREWLSSNAALGYIDYQAEQQTFSLSPEQAAVFAHDGKPTCMQGFFQAIVAQYETHETATEVFKTGRGRPWGEHSSCCFCGTDRFFRPGYAENLVQSWIPALEGMHSRLQQGGKIADIGCGHGSSTILLAQAYPECTVHGFDFHEPSIIEAKAKAKAAGISNVEFHASAAKDFQENDFDLACIFDALHDMGDPVGAATHVKQSLKPDGTFMVVEPLCADQLEDNLNVLAGIFYGFSTTICVPTSRAQEVGMQLGAQAGEKRLTDVLHQAGFSQVRRATETPINMILEAKA